MERSNIENSEHVGIPAGLGDRFNRTLMAVMAALAVATAAPGCEVERENDEIGLIGADVAGKCLKIADLNVKTDKPFTVTWGEGDNPNQVGFLPPGGYIAACNGTEYGLDFDGPATMLATDRVSGNPAVLRFTPKGAKTVVSDGLSVDKGEVEVEVP